MKKRVAAVVLAMTLAFSATGCGSEPKQEEGQAAAQEQEQNQQEQDQSEEEQQQEQEQEQQEQEDVSEEASEAESEEESQSDYVDPNEAYQNIISTLDELVDSEKTYTQEEFEELVAQLFDRIDYITYNAELGEDAQAISQSVGLTGAGIKDFFGRIFYNIYGSYGSCSEMGVEVIEVNGNELGVEIRFVL